MYDNFRNLKQATVKRTEVSEEEVFFRVMRDIQGLDIILSLQSLGYYKLSYRSMFPTINLNRLLKKLARRNTKFQGISNAEKI